MTPEFKLFLTEFAALLEKHEIEIEATIDGEYGSYCDGIDIYQPSTYDKDGNTIREGTCFSAPKTFDSQYLLNVVKDL